MRDRFTLRPSPSKKENSPLAKGAMVEAAFPRRKLCLGEFDRFDHHKLAHRALVEELDAARNFGEQRVIFATAHVEARLYARAALANDDSAARHQLSAECFET